MNSAVSTERISELESERDFLLRSLEDLDEEHRAGEVSDDDYSRLKDSYTARAADVLRALHKQDSSADGSPSPVDPGTKPATVRRGRNQWLLVGGIALILAGVAAALISANTGTRLPGNTLSGGVSLAPQQQEARELEQASVLEQDGNDAGALELFDEVLSQQPNNVDALASAGWIEFDAGVSGTSTTSLEKGETDEEKAVSLDPSEPVPHAYLATMLFVEGQSAEAVIQYGQFLASNPTGSEAAPFVPDMKKAYEEEKTPLPALPLGS